MRPILALLLLAALLLAGCGDDGSGGADQGTDGPGEPAPSSQSDGAEPSVPDGASDDGWQLVEIVHATAAGGQVSTTPVPIGDAEAVTDFSAQFTRPQLEQEILRVLRTSQVPTGTEMVAAVIAIGCDVPPGVTYVDGEVRPQKVVDPHRECYAPVTSVAILAVVA